MLKSCETLITKINEWQKAILRLEELSNEFLNTGDEKIKEQIDNQKKEIEKYNQEYLGLAYPELLDRRVLFWPEKEVLKEIAERTGRDKKDGGINIEVKGYHVVAMDLTSTYFNLSQFPFDFSLFHNLEKFYVQFYQLKKFPRLPSSIKYIWIEGNPGITKKEKKRIKKEYPNAKIIF